MKTDLEPQDIEAIAQRVAEILRPQLTGMQHVPDERYMNVKQLANYTGMSSSWIYNNKKSLPHRNLGGKPLFRKSEIDTWLEQYRVQPDTPAKRLSETISIEKPADFQGFKNQKLKRAVTSR